MYYVYLIESVSAQGERYLGMTTDLKERLQEHNAGKSSHTSKFKPWKLITYIAFTDRSKGCGLMISRALGFGAEFFLSVSVPIPSMPGGVSVFRVLPVFRPK